MEDPLIISDWAQFRARVRGLYGIGQTMVTGQSRLTSANGEFRGDKRLEPHSVVEKKLQWRRIDTASGQLVPASIWVCLPGQPELGSQSIGHHYSSMNIWSDQFLAPSSRTRPEPEAI
jgi:hypothetical protein